MINNPTNFEQFESLLMHKHYGDLSESEKGIVAEFCGSAQEFGLMKKMILTQSPDLLTTQRVPKNLLDKLAENKNPTDYQRFISLKVPFWLYLVSLIIIFGLTYLRRPTPVEIKEIPQKIIRETPKEIIKTDTFVQYAYRIDTLYIRGKEARTSAEAPKKERGPVALVKNASTRATTQSKIQRSLGRTIKQDPDFKSFFTDIQ